MQPEDAGTRHRSQTLLPVAPAGVKNIMMIPDVVALPYCFIKLDPHSDITAVTPVDVVHHAAKHLAVRSGIRDFIIPYVLMNHFVDNDVVELIGR